MNNDINQFKEQTFFTQLQGIKDPIPLLIEKLSSGKDIIVKLSTEDDTLILNNSKKNIAIQIKADFEQKEFKLPTPGRILQVFSNKRCRNFPTREQKHLLEKLKFIPVYTVVNKKNEIVTASPRESKESNSLDWFQNKYNELFFWTGDNGSISLSLFFMNKEDAATYLHEICKKEPKESEILGLSIKTVGLDVFYRFNRTSAPKTQTRLIADLREIDLILTKYKSLFNCTLNPKQKHSKTWFQGTPIYSFKLQKTLGQKILSQYYFDPKIEKKVIFFTRADAIKAWKVYTSKNSSDSFEREPNLEIYNLENLLLDLENDEFSTEMETIIVPPYESYENWKLSEKKTSDSKTSLLEEYLFKSKLNLQNLQRFYKGIVWLFTSDTLPSEENSW
jgi:hypothetical protein